MKKTLNDWLHDSPALCHYNHNHDKLGRFARSNGANSSGGMHELDINSKKGQEFVKEAETVIKAAKKGAKGIDIVMDGGNKPTKIKGCKSIEGKEMIVDEKYGELAAFGKSLTKTYKQEVRSKDGVHIIQSKPTNIEFENIASSDNSKTVDPDKVKQLDSYALSKEGNKALEAGKKQAAAEKLDTYLDWSNDTDSSISSKRLPEKYTAENFSRDLSPRYISYGFNKNTGKPEIKTAEFVDKRDNFAGHSIIVNFDNGKADYIELAG